MPLVLAAALVAFGLTRRPWVADLARTAVIGFGLVALPAALHALALRFPRRYAVDGFAWVLTAVAVLVALVFAMAGGR